MSKDIWYPLSKPDDDRMIIENGEGIYVIDSRGKKYLDANSGLWNIPLGYSNHAIRESLVSQLDKICYVNSCEFGNTKAIELAELIKKINHENIDKIIYTCTGSESVEVAIKLIRKYASMGSKPHKRDIAIIRNSYHGSYYGSMSCSSYEGQERKGYFPLLSGVHELSLPFCNCCKSDDVSSDCTNRMKEQLEKELEAYEDYLGGFLVEPILGSAGVIELPKWFIERIIEFSNKHDLIVVFDEVATGFGRTGSMFYYQKYGWKPDIITMSKGINNGTLPLGAVAISKKITDRFSRNNELIFHLSTQNGNALSCAAGIATITELLRDDGNIIQEVVRKSEYFKRHFKDEIENKFTQVHDLRSIGLMFAIDIIEKDNKSKIKPVDLIKIVQLLKKNGLIVEWSYIENMTSSIVLFLPFIITECEIHKVLEILKIVFEKTLI